MADDKNPTAAPAVAAEVAEVHPAEVKRERAIAKLITSKRARSRAHAEFLIKTESVVI